MKTIDAAEVVSIKIYSVRRLPPQPREDVQGLYHQYPVLGATTIVESTSTLAGIIRRFDDEIIPPIEDHRAFDARFGLSISYKTKTVDYLLSSGCLHGIEFDHDKIKSTFSLRRTNSTSKTLENFLLMAGVPLELAPR